HGIPSPHRRLAEGDIVGLDLGCIVEGYYADCAFTVPVGTVPPNVQKLLDVTRESLELAIKECWPGRRLSDVSHAVQSHVETHGLSVVRAFVGHGIGRALHEEPQDRKSTRLNSSHDQISYAVFCLKKKRSAETLGPADPPTRPRPGQHHCPDVQH